MVGERLLKHSDHLHGALYLLVSLGGMMLVVLGLIGFALSL
jgi:hypothetical protein